MAAPDRAVLVVEDDPDMREVEVLMLTGAGYRVMQAADGVEALEQVAAEMPGLILLDMRMPRMNGWEFAREFRSRYNSGTPIVVVTAAPDADARADEIAADGCLSKPFRMAALLEAVRRHLPRSV